MKILGNITRITGVYDAQKNLSRIEKSSGVSSKKDVVSISSEAKDFQTVLKTLKEVPDIRVDKINEVSEKFESGSYNVSGRDVADKIVKSLIDKRI